MRPSLFIVCLIVFSSCAHQARTYKHFDATPLQKSSAGLNKSVSEARENVKAVSTVIANVREKLTLEKTAIESIRVQLEDIKRVAPPELMPRIEATEEDMDKHQIALGSITADVLAGQQRQAVAIENLEQSNAFKNEMNRLMPALIAHDNDATARANEAEAAWEKDSKEIVKMKTESWFHRILGILGLLAVGTIIFLWWSGRIAKAGADIAKSL